MWFDPPTSTCSLTSFLFPPCCSPHLPFSPGCYGTLNRPLANGDGSASRLPTHNCPIKLRLVGAIKQFEASLRSRPQRALLPIPFTCQTCHVLDYDSPLVSFGAVGSFVASLGKNTSSIHRILDNLHESFPMCKLLQVPTHSPKPACALKSALEVSLWTLPKWPKTGGPPAEPSVWKWADSLPRKDVTIQIRKFFTWNFIRQIYQNLIYHDLSWFIIYSYLFMELTSQKVCYLDPCSKVTSTLSICSTGPLHRRGQTWTWSVGRFSNCQLPQPGKRLEIRPPALEERLPFWPKETPIKETAKVLHQRPQASEDHILWDIWFDFTKKKHCLGRSLLMYFWFMLIYLWVVHTDCWCISEMSCGMLRPEPWRLKSSEHGTSKVGSQQTQTSKLVSW